MLVVATGGIAAQIDWKESARAAADSNIDLSSSSDPNPVGGVTLNDGDRVLLKSQSTASENGLYSAVTATDPTTWTRTTDADEDQEVTAGMAVPIEEGDNAGVRYVLTTSNPITVGSTGLTFSSMASLTDHGQLAGLADDDHTQYLRADGVRNVTGDLTFEDAVRAFFGNNDDAAIFWDTNRLEIDFDVQGAGTTDFALLANNSDVLQIDRGAVAALTLLPEIQTPILIRDTGSNSDGQSIHQFEWRARDDQGNDTFYVELEPFIANAADGFETGGFRLLAQDSATTTEPVRIAGKSISLSAGVFVNAIRDEDNLSSGDPNAVPTQQSVQQYASRDNLSFGANLQSTGDFAIPSATPNATPETTSKANTRHPVVLPSAGTIRNVTIYHQQDVSTNGSKIEIRINGTAQVTVNLSGVSNVVETSSVDIAVSPTDYVEVVYVSGDAPGISMIRTDVR